MTSEGGPVKNRLEEDSLVLHDLKGVNLTAGFFLGTRKEFLDGTKCISYSVCYNSVDVLIYQVTLSEQISDIEFYSQTKQLYIDEHEVSGDVFSFRCEKVNGILSAFCTILLGRDY